jgi:2-C-methyl-D-erythritol 2,4-cyclodiphosphate synthase
MAKSNYRIGHGYDVHRLEEGADFWIGGIKLEHTKGAVGHSDADVVLHVICDALLGAMSLGDIGSHFPDTDKKFKGIDSKILLRNVIEIMKEKHFEVVNMDVTVMLEKPKLRDHIDTMRKTIAGIVRSDISSISVKATTTEGLGFIGREEGVAAHCVCLLKNES